MADFDSTFTDEELQSEEWQPVLGFESIYQASSLGRIRRIEQKERARAGHILKPGIRKDRFRIVVLCRDGAHVTVYLHRIIATAFLENTQNKKQVNHKDGDRGNNRIVNLEWVTASENIQHGYDTGLIPMGEKKRGSKLSDAQIVTIMTMLETMKNQQIADKFGVSRTIIRRIRRGQTRKHITAIDCAC